MSERREFLKKIAGVGVAAGAISSTAKIDSVGGGNPIGFGERQYERLVAEVRMSPSVRVMARTDPKIRQMVIDDALQVLREAMENDDGSNPPII